ncbi:hypothetical protein F2Y74_23790, partial [Bacteroides cellulosilyticus]
MKSYHILLLYTYRDLPTHLPRLTNSLTATYQLTYRDLPTHLPRLTNSLTDSLITTWITFKPYLHRTCSVHSPLRGTSEWRMYGAS